MSEKTLVWLLRIMDVCAISLIFTFVLDKPSAMNIYLSICVFAPYYWAITRFVKYVGEK